MTVLLKAKILKTVLRHKRLPNSAQAPSLKNKGVNMRYFLTLLCAAFFMVGCSNTWHGAKEDTGNAVEWSKDKVNKGATYVKEKTE